MTIEDLNTQHFTILLDPTDEENVLNISKVYEIKFLLRCYCQRQKMNFQVVTVSIDDNGR